MSGCRSKEGRLFQILGPATEKLLLPSQVFVLRTVRMLAWAERSWRRSESTISWHLCLHHNSDDTNFTDTTSTTMTAIINTDAAAVTIRISV